ncbi:MULTISPECIES: ANTAR domain-containing protein [Nocardia]|uniref:ANTAR domain-containing protein n=1 Tax=Nocardia TaxID=1817 RepID=UPI0022B81183|nr:MULTISPECIES: ANTAR domain-containing protein [Nocardia]
MDTRSDDPTPQRNHRPRRLHHRARRPRPRHPHLPKAVTRSRRRSADRRETLDEQLPEIVAAREVIDVAKGVLMVVYGINTEQAFQVLRWRSQETNTKLRTLAEKLIAGLASFGGADTHTRTRLDHLLLTAHETP